MNKNYYFLTGLSVLVLFFFILYPAIANNLNFKTDGNRSPGIQKINEPPFHKENKFIFGSLPDPHIGDFAIYRECEVTDRVGGIFKSMKEKGCELVLVPGDWTGGHWEQQGFVDEFGEDPVGRILPLAKKVNDCWKMHCSHFGLEQIVSPGDHEYGDNPWGVNSGRAEDFPYYREGFARAFCLDEEGNNIYDGTIGGVPQRPVGTDYENTSFAVIRENVMFVSLDLFRFDSPSVDLGWEKNGGQSQGAVSGELTPDQGKWLDDILAAGKASDEVDFVVVQSHMPVALPILLHASSALTIKDNDESPLWGILKKNGVDVYIAGEVHAVTVSKDEESQLVQFVHGIRTFGIWEAKENELKIQLYNENDPDLCLGTMIIRKDGEEKTVEATDAMTPLGNNDLLIHYSFDDANGFNIVENTGVGYRSQLDGQGVSVKQENGILGKAGYFSASDSSHVLSGDEKAAMIWTDVPRSLSTWIKTESEGENHTILSLGNNPEMSMNLIMHNGNLAMQARGQLVLTTIGEKINDNEWHMVSLTYPGKGTPLETTKLYIDGQEVNTRVSSKPTDWERRHTDLIVGAARTGERNKVITYYPSKKVEIIPAEAKNFYTGIIDDVALWHGALPSHYVKVIYNAAITPELRYNAADIRSLFKIWEGKTEGNVGEKVWKWTKCPKGSPGEIIKSKDKYYIIMNDKGYGLSTL